MCQRRKMEFLWHPLPGNDSKSSIKKITLNCLGNIKTNMLLMKMAKMLGYICCLVLGKHMFSNFLPIQLYKYIEYVYDRCKTISNEHKFSPLWSFHNEWLLHGMWQSNQVVRQEQQKCSNWVMIFISYLLKTFISTPGGIQQYTICITGYQIKHCWMFILSGGDTCESHQALHKLLGGPPLPNSSHRRESEENSRNRWQIPKTLTCWRQYYDNSACSLSLVLSTHIKSKKHLISD